MLIFRLPNKLPEEKILKILRRDFFVFFLKILFFLLLVTLPLAVGYILVLLFPALINDQIYFAAFSLITSAYALFIWIFFFFSFIDYYLDVWIITNERIIDIRQNGFFSRTIAEQRLNRIQDVTSDVQGVLPTIFRYGNVYVQTAAEVGRFSFEQIPNPENVRDQIIKLSEISKRKHEEGSRNQEV